MTEISKERATAIARSTACARCGEYNFKQLKVREASDNVRHALGEVWHVVRTCGVCGARSELGLDAEGDVLYGA